MGFPAPGKSESDMVTVPRLTNCPETSSLLGSNMAPVFADLDCDDDLGLVKNLDRETTSS